jgi:hypothetical protein
MDFIKLKIQNCSHYVALLKPDLGVFPGDVEDMRVNGEADDDIQDYACSQDFFW